jgi:hypothetical protein
MLNKSRGNTILSMSIALAISSILVLGMVRNSAEEAKLAKSQVVKNKLKMAGDAVGACLSFISSSSYTYQVSGSKSVLDYCVDLSGNITNTASISSTSSSGSVKTFTYALHVGPGFNASNYKVSISAVNNSGGTSVEGYQAYVIDTSIATTPDILNKYPLANIGYILGSEVVLNGQFFKTSIIPPTTDKAYPLYYILQAVS